MITPSSSPSSPSPIMPKNNNNHIEIIQWYFQGHNETIFDNIIDEVKWLNDKSKQDNQEYSNKRLVMMIKKYDKTQNN